MARNICSYFSTKYVSSFSPCRYQVSIIRTMANTSKDRTDYSDALHKAATALRDAKALIITAGAGMGVDSGLPDFRGPQGFWRAYPLLKGRGIKLSDMSNPAWFDKDPQFAWWFFGHRYNLYSQTTPHEGFNILLRWAKAMEHGYFVFTSNVDGHFQKAGFGEDHVLECHGSINFMQCCDPRASPEIWPVPSGTSYDIDNDTMEMNGLLPTGPPGHNHPARPNILMFGDYLWAYERTDKQQERFDAFINSLNTKGGIPFVVFEIGAGMYVPTVRMTGESLVGQNKGTLIRINPREPEVPKWPKTNISLPLNGLQCLTEIDKLVDM